MTPQRYRPAGESVFHEITAESIQEDNNGSVFRVLSDGEEIGEVDLDTLTERTGWISGVGPGEKINNGYLRPACLVILSCMLDRDPGYKGFYSVDDEFIVPH